MLGFEEPEENSSIAGQTGRELRLDSKELEEEKQ